MKKKILIFGMRHLVGGVENYIITILQNIDRKKFDIDLLVKEDITGINGEKIKGYYNNIYKMPNIFKHPIKTFSIIKKLSLENHYDVAHFNICLSAPSVFAAILKHYSKNTKIFIHSHNGSTVRKLRHYTFRPLLNKIADKKIACSETAAIWMFGKKAVKNNEVILCNNFIDTDKFLFNEKTRSSIRNELNIADKFVIGHVGRFANQKNHKGLIEIFAKIAKQNNNVVLVLLGTGELEEEIKKYVNNLELNDKVLFLGLKPNTNEYYQAMDLFLLPSFFEGLPIVGIEAQASGLKCLFADTIDRKSDISGNVKFLSLDNKKLWETEIHNIIKSNYKRQNMKKVIVDAGYDMRSEIKKIEALYQKGD